LLYTITGSSAAKLRFIDLRNTSCGCSIKVDLVLSVSAYEL